MTDADIQAIARAETHTAIDAIFEQARLQAHQAVQADDNARALVRQLDAELDRYRKEVAQLHQSLLDARESHRAYAVALTAVREALGATDDADLVEAVERLRAESEGRRKALEQVGEERRAEWERAEQAEGILRGLVWAIADEQEDPGELARALGKEAPYWISQARAHLKGERDE